MFEERGVRVKFTRRTNGLCGMAKNDLARVHQTCIRHCCAWVISQPLELSKNTVSSRQFLNVFHLLVF